MRITFPPLKWDLNFTHIYQETQSRIDNFYYKVFFFLYSASKGKPYGNHQSDLRNKSSKHSFVSSSPSHNRDPKSPSHPTHDIWHFKGNSWPRGGQKAKSLHGKSKKSPFPAGWIWHACKAAQRGGGSPSYHLSWQRESIISRTLKGPADLCRSSLWFRL